MRHQIRGIFRSTTAIALLLFVAACGGKETVASKSAEAFREAQQKGTPVGGGHAGHDGVATDSTADAGTSSVDHSTMAGMDHSTMTERDHSNTGVAAPSAMAGMDHSKMTVNSASTIADMDHSSMPGMSPANRPRDQQPMAGMDHSGMPGMQHGAAGDAKVATAAPRSNAEMQRMQPASTLRPDAFDAPAAISVAEAAKATQGGGHGGQQKGGTSAPVMDHSQHGSPAPSSTPQATTAATIYACPMHPEVTSDKPGTCPKCGMTLVKKTG